MFLPSPWNTRTGQILSCHSAYIIHRITMMLNWHLHAEYLQSVYCHTPHFSLWGNTFSLEVWWLFQKRKKEGEKEKARPEQSVLKDACMTRTIGPVCCCSSSWMWVYYVKHSKVKCDHDSIMFKTCFVFWFEKWKGHLLKYIMSKQLKL